MTPNERPVLTEPDCRRLDEMARSLRKHSGPHARYAVELERRVRQAHVVAAASVGDDVVTMNSRVRLRDVATGKRETFTLVYRSDSGGLDETLSVLTPLGSALLGARVGDVVEWRFRRGVRRLEVERVLYQPEAAGDFDL
jgi:regulator of nucleoside diphosphate kinase